MNLNPIDLQTLSRLLDQAMDLEVEQLDGWLAGLGEEHSRLIPQLREMLVQHRSQDQAEFMADGPRLADDTVARHGDLVGPYRLIREIGRGGMGTVWLAERADGSLKRQVALKLPRLAWGAGLSERMARERDIGALLEHPNIARLYDAGVDERGRPFLALEYIDGQSIDAWCTAKRLDVRAKLRLFVQVARAVAYAHGRLVIHRDLKPSNVLVTADGQAHLLDFGIAKLLHETAPGEARLTQDLGRVLTPHYASPEQLRGETVAVASDVYSLGVLLFELLTGRHPYEPERKSLAALEAAVLEGEPPVASSRAANKSTVRALSGDLDAILSKALKREPAQRYPTADALVEDIERHLAGERVLAQPDRIGYRLGKALQRHRVGFGAAAAVMLAGLAGVGVSLVQAQRANDSAERARVVKAFVVDVFKVNERGNPANNELRQLPAELLLERGARLIETKFAGQPGLQAELYGVVGGIFADMGSAKLAADYATRQIEALTVDHASDADQARAMMLLADSLAQQDRLSDAAPRARRALQLSVGQPLLEVRARVGLARILTAQAQYAEANGELDRVELAVAAQPKPMPTELAAAEAESLWLRAQLQRVYGDFSTYRPLWERAIAAALAAEGPTSRLAATMRIDYAYRLVGGKLAAEATGQLSAAVDAMRAIGGPDDIGAALAYSRVSAAMFEDDQIGFSQALATVTESQRILARQGALVPAPVRARVEFDLGWIYRNWGDVEKAYALQSDASKVLRPLAESPFDQRVLDTSLGMDAAQIGKYDEADVLLRRGLESRKRDSATRPWNVSIGYEILAENLLMQGRYSEAEQQLNAAPTVTLLTPLVSAEIRLEQGKPQDVLAALSKYQASNNRRADDSDLRGAAMCQMGRTREGLSLLDAFILRRTPVVYEHEPSLARARSLAGLCALSAGDRNRATEYAALARRAFTAQPNVSPYFKAPLLQLEQKLATR